MVLRGKRGVLRKRRLYTSVMYDRAEMYDERNSGTRGKKHLRVEA